MRAGSLRRRAFSSMRPWDTRSTWPPRWATCRSGAWDEPSMKYGELFHFDPIEAIVQLKHANELQRAQALVESYVVSENMADRLVEVVLPQLQFLSDEDNKGVFIVGNYG